MSNGKSSPSLDHGHHGKPKRTPENGTDDNARRKTLGSGNAQDINGKSPGNEVKDDVKGPREGSTQSARGDDEDAQRSEGTTKGDLAGIVFYFAYDKVEDLHCLEMSLGNWTVDLGRGTSQDLAVQSAMRRLSDSIPKRRTR